MKLLRYFTLITTILCFSQALLFGQSMSKFYKSSTTDKGILYFIKPQKMKITEGKKLAAKKLYHDYTYVQNADSVRLLLTLKTKEVFTGDSIYFYNKESKLTSYPLKTIYKEYKSHKWVNRLESFLAYKDWYHLYSGDKPAAFFFKLKDGKEIHYSFTECKWKKLKTKYQIFYEMLKLNP